MALFENLRQQTTSNQPEANMPGRMGENPKRRAQLVATYTNRLKALTAATGVVCIYKTRFVCSVFPYTLLCHVIVHKCRRTKCSAILSNKNLQHLVKAHSLQVSCVHVRKYNKSI